MADVPLVNQADMVDGDDDISPKMRMIEASFKGNLKDYKRKMNSCFYLSEFQCCGFWCGLASLLDIK